MQIKPIEWIGNENGYLKLIDQTKLPHKLVYIKCHTYKDVADAIKTMKVRGAPLLGIAAAFGAYLGIRATDSTEFHKRFLKVYKALFSTRPTAVNLKWALDRIAMALKNGETEEPKNKKVSSSVLSFFSSLVYKEALKILKEDRETCYKIGINGAKLIKNGLRILTYCNAGLLATGGSGTALSVLYQAKRQGKRFSVFACETRPLLQGARLTVWELQRNKIPITLICDNMVGRLMQEKKIDLVIVGADRIAKNGDTANKIGTYQVALLSHHHRIPFYVAAPLSTVDPSLKTGKDIPIEERSEDEVTQIKMIDERGKMREGRIAPRSTHSYNPAFDVTQAKYITGFITERRIIRGAIKTIQLG